MIRRVYTPAPEPVWSTDKLGNVFLSVAVILLSLAAIGGVGVASLF